MKKIKCPICGQTLFYAESGVIEIKCSRKKCGKIIRFEITSEESVKHTVIRE
jgi:phage FluMu protein Com